jgi:hypothetical protein
MSAAPSKTGRPIAARNFTVFGTRLDCSLHGSEQIEFIAQADVITVRNTTLSLAGCGLAGIRCPSRRRQVFEGVKTVTSKMPRVDRPTRHIKAVAAQFGGIGPWLEAIANLPLPATDPKHFWHWWVESRIDIDGDRMLALDPRPGCTPATAYDALVIRDGADWRYAMSLEWPTPVASSTPSVMEGIARMELAHRVPSCEVHALRAMNLRLPPIPLAIPPFGAAAWYRDAAQAMLNCLANGSEAAAEAIRKLALAP